MRLHINGKEHDMAGGTTLLGLIEGLGFDPTKVVVEHNTRIVQRADFDSTTLEEGDRLELLQFVGGG